MGKRVFIIKFLRYIAIILFLLSLLVAVIKKQTLNSSYELNVNQIILQVDIQSCKLNVSYFYYIQVSLMNTSYHIFLILSKAIDLKNLLYLYQYHCYHLLECIKYWKEWQEINKEVDIDIIKNEYIRNCNRYIIDKLINEGYSNVSGININITREELKKRLYNSGVEIEKIKKLIRQMRRIDNEIIFMWWRFR